MSSSAYATPLVLEPRPSRQLLSLALLVHAGALALLPVLAAIPWPLRLLLAGLVVGSLWFELGRLGWRRDARRIRRLSWGADNDWRLELANGEELDARLLPSSFVHPRLVVLHLRVEGRRPARTLALMPDSLDAQSLRRLRVRLTTQRGRLFGGSAA